MTDPFAVLIADHRKVAAVFDELIGRDERDRRDTGDLAVRRDLTAALVHALSRHQAAEEHHLYPLIKATVPEGDALAARAVAEHREVEHTLARLDGLSPDSVDALGLLVTLREAVTGHVTEEEEQLFPLLRASASAAELDRLGRALLEAEAKAPTHPHPLLPHDPLSTRAAALIDRGRDMLPGHT